MSYSRRPVNEGRDGMEDNGMTGTNGVILEKLLSGGGGVETAEQGSLSEWMQRFEAGTEGWEESVDRALLGGNMSDRLAYAFAAGYECALRRLVPALPPGTIVSFCVTEEKGGHPSSIATALTRDGESPGKTWMLDGKKRFATMAPDAGLLLVAASTGITPEGRNMIRMVLVDRPSPGLAVTPMEGIPFIPEVSHGTVEFSKVRIDDARLLPGDGYADYIRPFRTIEDLHVQAAVLGHLLRIAGRYGWPREVIERLAGLVVCVRTLARDDPGAPSIHIAIAGTLTLAGSLIRDIEPLWDRTDEATKVRWVRDRALLGVAEKARNMRIETAWGKIG